MVSYQSVDMQPYISECSQYSTWSCVYCLMGISYLFVQYTNLNLPYPFFIPENLNKEKNINSHN